MRTAISYLIVVLVIISLGSIENLAQETVLSRGTFGAGGFISATNSKDITMSGIIGQFAIESVNGSTGNVLNQGFWIPEPKSSVGVEEPIVVNSSSKGLINYPNPLSTSTNIAYNLEGSSYVTLKIYDVMGNQVRVLVDGLQESGKQVIPWDAKNSNGLDVVSGSYVYELTVRPAQLAGGVNSQSYSLRNILVVVK